MVTHDIDTEAIAIEIARIFKSDDTPELVGDMTFGTIHAIRIPVVRGEACISVHEGGSVVFDSGDDLTGQEVMLIRGIARRGGIEYFYLTEEWRMTCDCMYKMECPADIARLTALETAKCLRIRAESLVEALEHNDADQIARHLGVITGYTNEIKDLIGE